MYDRLKDIFLILSLLLALLIVLTISGKGKTDRILKLTISKNMGMNSDLKAQIDSLELDITRRLNYEVEIPRDPLQLDKLLNLKGQGGDKEFKERQQALRLSCTILSPKANKAVIKYRSKSYVLAEGEEVAGYRVKSIEKKRVLLSKNGTITTLINRPAPKSEKIRDSRKDEKEIKL